jgi:hypothetical protein
MEGHKKEKSARSWEAIAKLYVEKCKKLEEQLRCEKTQNIEEVKKIVERLKQTEKEKNELKESNRKLESQYRELRIKLKFSEDKNCINEELNQRYKQVDKEAIKDEVLQYLYYNGNMCVYSCVLSSIHWVCRHILNAFLCDRQLEKLISMYAAENVQKEDLMCENLLAMLIKCGLVCEVNRYEYSPNAENRDQEIDHVWKEIMTMPIEYVQVLILARLNPDPNGVGHAVVCDLNTRTTDRLQVTINDPQIWWEQPVNQDVFRQYVNKDQGLIIYGVNIDKLIEIIIFFKDIIHHTIFTAPQTTEVLQ